MGEGKGPAMKLEKKLFYKLFFLLEKQSSEARARGGEGGGKVRP